ncbi:hypothetical protein DVH24_019995 [Malus domestica]|uniref:ABCC10-like N-terminal domain-containing protein n=1 Tax=Malus domestica TaxID=3750 RepID=A0A498I586_MALDO|nr:hypothetical protein DVH24_019995 [Malus domestica]
MSAFCSINDIPLISSDCSTEAINECSSGILAITNQDSCINHILVIAADILLVFILLCYGAISVLSIISAAFNSGLALASFGFGIWTVFEKVHMVSYGFYHKPKQPTAATYCDNEILFDTSLLDCIDQFAKILLMRKYRLRLFETVVMSLDQFFCYLVHFREAIV